MEDRYLFKAKFDDSDRWVKGQLVEVTSTYLIIPNHASTILADWFSASNVVEVKKDTICQCTGLKDKNGNLIWENDIVRGKMHGNYGYRKLVGVVQYYIDAFKVNVKPNSFWGDYKNISNACEVIGNVFDNKELLESEG